jgi:membrane protein implicated in regulation of membrane protease activity
MGRHKLLASAIVVLATVIAALWVLSLDTGIGWLHVAGLGLSVVLLVLIWLWPGRKEQQPRRPPP